MLALRFLVPDTNAAASRMHFSPLVHVALDHAVNWEDRLQIPRLRRQTSSFGNLEDGNLRPRY